jgi:hypothetical protein
MRFSTDYDPLRLQWQRQIEIFLKSIAFLLTLHSLPIQCPKCILVQPVRISTKRHFNPSDWGARDDDNFNYIITLLEIKPNPRIGSCM